MTISFWQRLDRIGRNLAPFVVTIMLVLVSLVPTHIPGYGAISPWLALSAVYYWAIHRPDLLWPSGVFVVGLLADLLTGGPLGLNALVLVTIHWAVLTQRRYFLASTFSLMWFGFSMTALAVALMQWSIFSLLNAQIMPFAAVFFQALLTLALFPAPAWLFIRVHRAFLQV